MGVKKSASNALTVQLDATGKIKYDAIARVGHSKDKVSLMNPTGIWLSKMFAC